jgi:Class II Aldolase and Adducin N-terminal domain
MSNLQTIIDGASESIEGLDGLLHSGERQGERTCEEERRWRKERVAGALRLLARFGINDGAAGHITARDPEDPDTFWVNRALKNFATMHAHSTYGKIWSTTGRPLDPAGPVGASGTGMESSSPSTATSPNLRRGGVHRRPQRLSRSGAYTCTFVSADLTFWFDD